MSNKLGYAIKFVADMDKVVQFYRDVIDVDLSITVLE